MNRGLKNKLAEAKGKFTSNKSRLTASAAVVVVLSGAAIAAVAATGDVQRRANHGHARLAGHRLVHGGQTRDVALAANYLGMSVSQLRSELQSGKALAEVANARRGKSASGLIEALIAAKKARLARAAASLPRRVTAEVSRLGGASGGGRGAGGLGAGIAGRGPGVARGPLVTGATSYLGISPAQLHVDLQSGKTLAQVADSTSGKSANGLIAALLTARRQQLAAAVAAGLTTPGHEALVLANLPKRVTALVNGESLRRAAGGGRRHASRG